MINIKKNHVILGSIALLFVLTVMSCKKDEVVECDGTVYSFSQEVLPLMNSSCNTTGCHALNSTFGDFTTYAGVSAKVSNGSLKARILDGSMPKNSSINLAQKEMIVCWIEGGALDN
ncbi:MAG: hypothetical protein ACI837_003090 [Crocinitomicaceae bacterium]|jgi:hypothetical protein